MLRIFKGRELGFAVGDRVCYGGLELNVGGGGGYDLLWGG